MQLKSTALLATLSRECLLKGFPTGNKQKFLGFSLLQGASPVLLVSAAAQSL